MFHETIIPVDLAYARRVWELMELLETKALVGKTSVAAAARADRTLN